MPGTGRSSSFSASRTDAAPSLHGLARLALGWAWFIAVAEEAYGVVARNRMLFSRITPGPNNVDVVWLQERSTRFIP